MGPRSRWHPTELLAELEAAKLMINHRNLIQIELEEEEVNLNGNHVTWHLLAVNWDDIGQPPGDRQPYFHDIWPAGITDDGFKGSVKPAPPDRVSDCSGFIRLQEDAGSACDCYTCQMLTSSARQKVSQMEYPPAGPTDMGALRDPMYHFSTTNGMVCTTIGHTILEHESTQAKAGYVYRGKPPCSWVQLRIKLKSVYSYERATENNLQLLIT